MEDFRKSGYLPEGLVNYLALVGWSPEGNEEILSMEEMIKQFSFERVAKTGEYLIRINWIGSTDIISEVQA